MGGNAPRITSFRGFNPMQQLQARWSRVFNHKLSVSTTAMDEPEINQ